MDGYRNYTRHRCPCPSVADSEDLVVARRSWRRSGPCRRERNPANPGVCTAAESVALSATRAFALPLVLPIAALGLDG
jgi:hypothetical protein